MTQLPSFEVIRSAAEVAEEHARVDEGVLEVFRGELDAWLDARPSATPSEVARWIAQVAPE